jgi:hypothetical protein
VRSPDTGRPDRPEPEDAVSVTPAREEVPVGKPAPSEGVPVSEPGPAGKPRPVSEPGPVGKSWPGAEPVPRPAALPEQSREDTDAGWGEYPERADDRLYRDRPPHWDDF